MKRVLQFFLMLGLAASAASAQNRIYLAPASSVHTPVGGIQSINANITGNLNQGVTWSTTCGAIIGSGANIGLKSTTAQTCTVTATMAADGTTAATLAVTFDPSPTDLQAAGIHPRIGITPADIAALQTKAASSGNVVYLNGVTTLMAGRQTYYNANFCFATSGCGYVGPKLYPTETPTSWTTDIYGNTTFTVSSNTWPVGAGGIPTGFASGSCFNGRESDVGYASGTTVTLYTGCPAGSATESGTLTSTLNSNGWIDFSNYFEGNGGGVFDNDADAYAYMANVDKITGNRTTWAAQAHDLLMWEIRMACSGTQVNTSTCIARSYSALGGNSNQPFTGAAFIMNNRAQTSTYPFLQGLDLIYPTLTTADKQTIAALFHIWGAQTSCANPNDPVSGTNECPQPTGTYNNPVLFNVSVGGEQGGLNNFGMGHFLVAATIGVLLDPADDPVVSSCASSTTTICASDGSAQVVSAYTIMAIKAYLYRVYAALEPSSIVAAAFGVTNPLPCADVGAPTYNYTIPCTGSQAGGSPAEGTGYGGLTNTIFFQGLYALYTAGKLNAATDPQASFISSAYWFKYAASLIYQLYPNQTGTNGGPYTPYGSDASGAVFNQQGQFMNALEVYAADFGSTVLKNMTKWYQYNVLYGGYSSFFGRFLGTTQPGNGNIGGTVFPFQTMIATDANNDHDFDTGSHNPVQNAYDPRNTSTMGVDFANVSSLGGLQRWYLQSCWGITCTQFQFGINTAVQDHAMPVGGRFDLILNGEPLSVALGGTSNNDEYAQSPSHQNVMALEWGLNGAGASCVNASVDNKICLQGGTAALPALFSNRMLGYEVGPTFGYWATDQSGGYNSSHDNCQWCASFLNVNLSQRELVVLRPGLFVVYDRADTDPTQVPKFKNWYMNTQTLASVSGAHATMTSTLGQFLYLTSLNPAGGTLTAGTPPTTGGTPPGSPYMLMDTGSTAASVRMLHVVEGKASGAATSASLVQSSAGTNYDGAVVGTTMVLFKQASAAATFFSTTFPASSATSVIMAGLLPNTVYPLTGTGTPATVTSDQAGIATFAMGGSGNVTVGNGTPPPTPTGAQLRGGRIRKGVIR